MYQRVLLAYDGTLEGARALREGALLARTCGAQVCLLSVVPQSVGVNMAEGVHCGVVGQLTDSYRDQLENAAARLRQLGFQPDVRLIVGEPAQTIGAVARKVGADLVVVGYRAQKRTPFWWSGSTHERLSDHLECSVLISRRVVSDEVFEAELQGATPPH